MDDADAKRAAEQQQLQNPFPTPPSYWNRYTPNNLRLLALLRSAQTDQPDEELDQEGVLKQLGEDSELLPSFPLVTLEPPRLDWVLEKGKYAAFGEVYSVCLLSLSSIRVCLDYLIDFRRRPILSSLCSKALQS